MAGFSAVNCATVSPRCITDWKMIKNKHGVSQLVSLAKYKTTLRDLRFWECTPPAWGARPDRLSFACGCKSHKLNPIIWPHQLWLAWAELPRRCSSLKSPVPLVSEGNDSHFTPHRAAVQPVLDWDGVRQTGSCCVGRSSCTARLHSKSERLIDTKMVSLDENGSYENSVWELCVRAVGAPSWCECVGLLFTLWFWQLWDH